MATVTSSKRQQTHTSNTYESNSTVTVGTDLTVCGGDITLAGTGRIQGIDTVSATTDAANKTYVDTCLAGKSPTAGSTSLTTAGNLTVDQLNMRDMGDYITLYGGDEANHSITSRNASGVADDDIRFNSYGSVIFNLDSNNNDTSTAHSSFCIGRHGSTGSISSWLFCLDGESGNGCFSGDLTVGGGDITLNGTGRIQGIDTVSSGTDAANKNYVDTCIAAVPTGDITQVVAGTNLTGGGTSGCVTINMATGGAGAGTYGSTSNSCKIDSITLDAYGRVTAVACGSTCIGDITGVTAGTGMTGGGDSGAVTLNVIGGDGITANADNIVVDSTVVRTSNAQTIAGVKTYSSRGDFSNADGLRTNQVRTYGGQQLVLNAGEASSYFTGQTNELVYLNAESGIEINSSPDNWSSGWAGRKTTTINDANGDSVFSRNITLGGTVDGVDIAARDAILTGLTTCAGLACVGDITAVVAGSGLTGGATSGSATVNVGAGTAITVAADTVGVTTACNTAWNAKTTCTGTTTPSNTQTFTNKSGNISQWTNDSGYTTCTGDITGVTAGTGMTGGGTSGSVTICHCDTSSQGSVNNSNGTVIQDVTLDTYGHVTALGSADLDGRYYTESEIQTFLNRSYINSESASNLAVGWYTIATNTGDRAVARFGLRDTNSSDHQSVVFYAGHNYGTDSSNTITVLHATHFGGSPFRYIRIKDHSTYDGAVLQVYIDDSSNTVEAYILGDNFQSSGWVRKDWIPDATDPGDVSNYASFTEKSKIDLDNIAQGGIVTTGPIYADGDLSQTKLTSCTGTTTPSNTQTFTNKSGNISQWTNNSGYTTCTGTGDITAVVAGSGLTGGATSGSATVNVGAGTAITVAADTVGVTTACNTAWNAKTTCTGTTTPSNTQTFTNKSGNISQWTNDSGYTTCTGTTTPSNTQTFTNKSGNISQWTNDSGYTTNTGDITNVSAGCGLLGGGSSGSVTVCAIINADFCQCILTTNGSVCLGKCAGKSITEGSGIGNVAIGACSLCTTSTGDSNLAIGKQALQQNSTGSRNVAIGDTAGFRITGSDNLVFGRAAGCGITSGSTNVAIGNYAMRTATNNGTGYDNVAIGNQSMRDVTSGRCNVSIGFCAIQKLSTGCKNVAIGPCALGAGTSSVNGHCNIAIGEATAWKTTAGSNNIAMGFVSLGCNCTGSCNVAIGFQSGRFSGTGTTQMQAPTKSIFIGCAARGGGGSATNNETVIGSGAVGCGSNTVMLGNSSVTVVCSNGTFSTVSDLRDKTCICDLEHGLCFIGDLKPKTFNMITDRDDPEGSISCKRHGFIAQDVLALEGEDNVIVSTDNPDQLGYTGEHIIPILVKGMQEQQAIIDNLTSRLEALEG